LGKGFFPQLLGERKFSFAFLFLFLVEGSTKRNVGNDSSSAAFDMAYSIFREIS
jgi:hypothetical protein